MQRTMRQIIGWSLLASLLLLSGTVSAQGSPEGAVRSFLEAWNNGEYARMYDLVHPRSKERYPAQAFEDRYRQVEERLGLNGVQYTLGETEMQGLSAAVTYDVTLETEAFGTVEDTGRTMRLVSEGGSWRVAWSTMDIFDMMADGAELRVVALPRERAPIYDRDGEIIASDDGTTVSLYSAKQNMLSEGQCVQFLAFIMRVPMIRLQRYFAQYATPDAIFYLGEITSEMYEIHGENLRLVCGILEGGYLVESQPHRTYYYGNAMTHVSGYVGQIQSDQLEAYLRQGYAEGDLVGQFGVEAVYDRVLAGQPERTLRIVGPGGTVLRELNSSAGVEPTPVTLTIDRELQRIVAQALSDAYNTARGNWGAPNISTEAAAVVIDVNTGAILAMASYPLADPHVFNPASVDPDRPTRLAENQAGLRNRAVEDRYAPGSIFKIITGTAALNEGFVTPDDVFYCDTYWDGAQYGDTLGLREDWRARDERGATGEVTPSLAVAASCNPFFWEYGAQLYDRTPDAVASYARRLGIGQPYGVEGVQREAASAVETPANISAAINEAVGQGDVALVPLQMAVATATVANGGTVYEPYLVQQVGGMDGTELVSRTEPNLITQAAFEPGVLETIREGMCLATTDDNLGTAINVFGDAPYSVCGKTGTAQAGFAPNSWFVSYTPADDPQIATAVVVASSREGSEVATPITRRILDNYYGAPQKPFPAWWYEEAYIPLEIPEGGGAG